MLVTLAANLIVSGLPSHTPKVYAAGTPQYTLYYPNDNKTVGDLVNEAKDGGIGSNDVNGALGQTYIMTKGGPVGAAKLALNGDFSNKHDVPIYSVDYYCSPNSGYSMSTTKPAANTTYIRYTLGVAITDYKGLTKDTTYPNRVGYLGDTYIGNVHLPELIDPNNGNVAAKDIPIPGKGGDRDIRDYVDVNFLKENPHGVANYDYLVNNVRRYVPSLPKDNPLETFYSKCFIPRTVNSKPVVTNFNKLSAVDQTDWKSAMGGTLTPPKSGNDNQASDSPPLDCGGGVLNWIVCPLITAAQGAAQKLDGLINNELSVDVHQTFNQDFYNAWSSFRIIATAILLIAGLIMVVSQAMGFELLDAYTIRKTLPRLLVAAIGISLSWPLMIFVVNFFNIFGSDVYGLIIGPFRHVDAHVNIGVGITTSLLVPLLAGAALFIYGPAALLIIVSGLFGLLIAFFILVVRHIAISAIVILAPLAIACYVLPNTQKVWNIWRENFLGLMMMFPIVMALIGAGHAFAAVSLHQGGGLSQFIGIIAYFIPYFLLPMAFKMATGIIGTVAGMVNDRSKGVFDRMKAARSNSAKQRHQMRMGGQTKFGSSRMGSLYRRGGMIGTPNSGALSMTKQGRANFAEAERTHLAHTTAEMLKNDNNRAAGDDTAMYAAYHAKNGNDFVKQYMARAQELGQTATEADARAALALTQSSFGSTMGSEAMKSAAFQARAASVTGYTGDDAGITELYKDAADAVNHGLMTTTDAAAAIKANKARVDQSGIGFGDSLKQIEATRQSGTVTDQQIKKLRQSALDGSMPGALISQRKEAVQAMVPHLRGNLQDSMNNIAAAKQAHDDGIANGVSAQEQQLLADRHANAIRDFKQQLASTAGMYDAMAQIAPQNARILADGLMGQGLVASNVPELGLAANNGGTGGVTVQSAIEGLRTDSSFQEMRREYGASATRQAAELQAQQGLPNNPIEPVGGIRR